MANQNTSKITYRQVGDYLIPNLTLPSKTRKPIGIWGQMHRDYLKKYNEVAFNIMLANDTLWFYLADIDEQASDMFSRLVDEMAKRECVNEILKEENQMLWIGKMNAIQEAAIEIINNDLIYT